MTTDVLRTGWYCPDCHRVFSGSFLVSDGRRFHNMEMCGTPLTRVKLVRA